MWGKNLIFKYYVNEFQAYSGHRIGFLWGTNLIFKYYVNELQAYRGYRLVTYKQAICIHINN
jgi:hypothetical protein